MSYFLSLTANFFVRCRKNSEMMTLCWLDRSFRFVFLKRLTVKCNLELHARTNDAEFLFIQLRHVHWIVEIALA